MKYTVNWHSVTFLILTCCSLPLASVIGQPVEDDVMDTSSNITAELSDDLNIGGVAWNDVTSNYSHNNQSDWGYDGYDVCEGCVSTVHLFCRNGSFDAVPLGEDVGQLVQYGFIYFGYSISLCACVIANVIYIITRHGLKGSPYHIHWNLIASFTLYQIVFLTGFSVVPSCYVRNLHVRNLLNVLMAYTVLANFFWMLVEGLILFCIVVKSFFREQKGRQFIKWCFLGWGTPAVLVIIWIIIETVVASSSNCTTPRLDVSRVDTGGTICLIIPVFLLLLINAIVLVAVMRNISKKLRAHDHREERKRHRRTAKSTMVLLILLGSYYALPILAALIGEPCLMVFIATIIGRILSSLQGLAVSTLYVFMNGEVRKVLNKRFPELNVSVMTGSTRLSSPSLSKRNSSLSSSEGRQARRSNLLEATEMSHRSKSDLNSNVDGGRAGGDDDRIVMEVGSGSLAVEGGSTGNQDVRMKTKTGAEYSKLDTIDPDA